MIHLEPSCLSLVKEILVRYIPEHEVRIFGSRVTGEVKPFSDIDLVIMNQVPLSLEKMIALKLAFEESHLPYKVDLVEWSSLSPEFQKRIEACYEVL